ncbi:gluconokinase [Pelomonas sp. KK5]|uniref:gluconokinase n=1 Tax=Pelomonas sp. KK5 TaxID=1855730 RepID=UPI00097C9F1E|nr:FGGY family carbohydrate kinase [Pelomonas sp. KK5]
MSAVMVGVDIGTTSTKAVVFTLDGKPVSQHTVEYPLLRPEPDAAEQDPRQILDAVKTALKLAVTHSPVTCDDVACVSFSAAMHSLIALDANGEPLTASITWADNRAAAQAARLKASPDGLDVYRRTGTPIHPMSPLAKLLWLRESKPALWQAATRFAGIKEFVIERLFGVSVVDHSIASATGLFNLQQRDWDDGALALTGLRREQLPAPVPTGHRLPALPCAAELGLPPDTPFVIGANDGVLSNLGVGAIGPGQLAVTIGTSGAMRAVVDRPLTDPEGRTFCYALTEKLWVVGGPVNNGGIVLGWIRDVLLAGEDADAALKLAESVPPGAGGLLFHPYLAGERAPFWNADLRASWFGLHLGHRKEHMVRAALEGVMFNLRGLLPVVEALVGSDCTIRATGGFARSPLWRQMMADVFERELVVPESVESSCLGAAVLGLHALGRIESLDAVNAMIGATQQHKPIEANAAAYRRLTPIFDALPRQLEQQYSQLAELQRRF